MADIEYLKTLQAVRERSRLVLEAARQGKTNNFVFHEDRMKDVTEFVASVIDVSLSPSKISVTLEPPLTDPAHSATLAPTTTAAFPLTDDGSTLTLAVSLVSTS